MQTLQEQIDTAKVRYHLGKVAVQVIKVPKKRVVQLKDGSFDEVQEHGIYLSRFGGGQLTRFSGQLDPDNEGDAMFIEACDKWIENNPQTARTNDIWKLGAKRPAPRVKGWDDMSAGQVESVLEATGEDLMWAMQHELLRPEELGGKREDVIDAIEALYAGKKAEAVEKSEEAPAL